MQEVDLIITNAEQIVTCASPSGPKRGQQMRDVGIIEQGGVAIHEGHIVAVGSTQEITQRYQGQQEIDASGRILTPGFVDCHTHLVFAGNRLDEFEMRIAGKSYLEIMAAGGGIVSTMKATRAASIDKLVELARPRLHQMQELGTTTIEIKTGYGLDTQTELDMLLAIERLYTEDGYRVVPTFLGAHAVPPEYRDKTEQFVDLVVQEMIPKVQEWYQTSAFAQDEIPLFIDVFTEQNAFDLEQSRRVLSAGQAAGMLVKIHADEFTSLGGIPLAIELGAVSVDHLDVSTEEELDMLAQSSTIGIVLPAVNFNLGSTHFADARGLIERGGALAIATDINPGSAPCPSLPLVMAMTCRYQKLLPSEALNAATINAAYAVGLGTQVGSLEVGKYADVLMLETTDYRDLSYQFGGNMIQMVIRQGRIL